MARRGELPEARHNLGRGRWIGASAVGEPGQRRFRVVADGDGGAACLWMEKEHLLQLAMAIKQVVGPGQAVEPGQRRRSGGRGPAGPVPEFQVQRMALAEPEQGEGLWALSAQVEDEARSGASTVVVAVTAEQLRGLSEEALAVCAAGRPLCPLCGAPVGPGEHRCARTNGHFAT